MKQIEYKGKNYLLDDLAKKLGLSKQILSYRAKKKIPLDKPIKKKPENIVKFGFKSVDESDFNLMFGADLFTGEAPLSLLEQIKTSWNNESKADFIVIHPLKSEVQPEFLVIGQNDNICILDIYVSPSINEGKLFFGTYKKKAEGVIAAFG